MTKYVVAVEERNRHKARRILEEIPSVNIFTSGYRDHSFTIWCFHVSCRESMRTIHSRISAADIPEVHVYTVTDDEEKAQNVILQEVV